MNLPVRDTQTYVFYRKVIGILSRTSVPFLMGGGFALEFYTHLGRGKKDMDLVIKRGDLEEVFEAFDSNLNSPFRTGLGRFIARMISLTLSSILEMASVTSTIFGSNTRTTRGSLRLPGEILSAGRNDLDQGLCY